MGPESPWPGENGFAAELRGFGFLGILAILAVLLSGNVTFGTVVVPFGALLVLAWVRASRTPWRDIGYARPRSWLRELALGVALGVALKLVMKAVVMPLLGAEPINRAYQHLVGNEALLPSAVWAMLMAGFGEETVFRGFLFERLGRLLRIGPPPWLGVEAQVPTARRRIAAAAIVAATAVLFGLGHVADQGVAGAQQATIFGLLFGAIYAVTGRLWMLMCAHTAFDLTALAIIYGNFERDVARLIFR